MQLIILVLSLLPGFVWLLFYLREDCHPEPARLIVLTFLAGAFSGIIAYFAQTLLGEYALKPLGVASLSTIALILMAAIEEIVKFGAAWITVHKNPEFDEPVDAMIYAVVAALGFATLENLGALQGNNLPETALISGAALNIAFQTVSLRFIGATLLHTLTSAVVGYYWAMDIREFFERRLLLVGLTFATVLHAVFNYLIINHRDLSYALIFVVTIGFFVLSDFEKFRKKPV